MAGWWQKVDTKDEARAKAREVVGAKSAKRDTLDVVMDLMMRGSLDEQVDALGGVDADMFMRLMLRALRVGGVEGATGGFERHVVLGHALGIMRIVDACGDEPGRAEKAEAAAARHQQRAEEWQREASNLRTRLELIRRRVRRALRADA